VTKQSDIDSLAPLANTAENFDNTVGVAVSDNLTDEKTRTFESN